MYLPEKENTNVIKADNSNLVYFLKKLLWKSYIGPFNTAVYFKYSNWKNSTAIKYL